MDTNLEGGLWMLRHQAVCDPMAAAVLAHIDRQDCQIRHLSDELQRQAERMTPCSGNGGCDCPADPDDGCEPTEVEAGYRELAAALEAWRPTEPVLDA